MGFRYRKSINLGGGFRVNLSGSGVGYSWGGRGFRVTQTASGRIRRTISIPGTGVSWVDESGVGRRRRTGGRPGARRAAGSSATAPNAGLGALTYSAGGDATFEPASENARRLILSLTTREWTTRALLALAVGALIVFALAGAPIMGLAFAAFALVGALASAWALRVTIDYEFDEEGRARESLRRDLIDALAANQALWQVVTINQTSSQKLNAGASNSAKRKSLSVAQVSPSFIKTNACCHKLELLQGKLFILPDRALLKSRSGWSVIEYSELHAAVSTLKLAETTPPTSDSTIVDSVWRYANADGSPDKRFSANFQLPVCVRGQVAFRTDSGFSAILYLSSIDATKRVNALINRLRSQF